MNKYNLEVKRANIIINSDGSSTVVWGSITGDITKQKDLQQELIDIKESIPNITGLATRDDLKSLVTMSYLGSNYYKKSEIYTKTEIDNKIGNIDKVLDLINGE